MMDSMVRASYETVEFDATEEGYRLVYKALAGTLLEFEGLIEEYKLIYDNGKLISCNISNRKEYYTYNYALKVFKSHGYHEYI